MPEYIDKNEVINKLIRLENNYQFYKEKLLNWKLASEKNQPQMLSLLSDVRIASMHIAHIPGK